MDLASLLHCRSRRQDLNLRQELYKSPALPAELHRHNDTLIRLLAMGLLLTQQSDSLHRSKTGTTRIVHRELFPNVLNSEGSVAEWHLQLGHLKPLMRLARVELACLLATDFKSVVYTNSTTVACVLTPSMTSINSAL